MQRLVVIAASNASVQCATELKRHRFEDEIILVLPHNLDDLQKPCGVAGKRLQKTLPDLNSLAAQGIGTIEAHEIMPDLALGEIVTTAERGELPIRYHQLIAEIQATVRLPRPLQATKNVFPWPLASFTSNPSSLDKALQQALSEKKKVAVVGASMAALDAVLLAVESKVNVLWFFPEKTDETMLNSHLLQCILQNLGKKVRHIPLTQKDIQSIAYTLNATGDTLLSIHDGKKNHKVACVLWTSPLMARHPLLREEGFTLNEHGLIKLDAKLHNTVTLIGDGVAYSHLQNQGAQIKGSPYIAFASAHKAVAHLTQKTNAKSKTPDTLSDTPNDTPNDAFEVVAQHEAYNKDYTVLQAGVCPKHAKEQGLPVEETLYALNLGTTDKKKLLFIHLLCHKPSQTLIGVQAAGIYVDKEMVCSIFDFATTHMLHKTPLSSLATTQVTGVAAQMLVHVAFILQQKTQGPIFFISPDNLIQSEKNGAEFFTLDLRSEHSWQRGHLPNATNIPFVQLEKRLQDEVPRYIPIVLISENSDEAFIIANKLAKLGATHLYILEGGMHLWPYAQNKGKK